MHICLVACSYDTDFEPVTVQIERKLSELRGVLDHFTLVIVNDALDREVFAQVVQDIGAPEIILHELETLSETKWGQKGLALREGMRFAMTLEPDYLAYINLNLKVDGKFILKGLELIETQKLDGIIGTRHQREGGQRIGAGQLGELKSAIFAHYARNLLPPINGFLDTNGPMKIFSAHAMSYIVSLSKSDGAFFDCEWLLILKENDLSIGIFPLIWIQRHGSRPPWKLVKGSLIEILKIRKRWRRGLYRSSTSG